MAAVILFIIICIGLYFLHLYMKKYFETNEHYRELAKFFSERELGIIKDNRYTKENHVDVIRRFFKEHPDKLAEAERKYKVDEQNRYIRKEEIKRELIKTRVFAYDYEEMLFQIFAQFESEHKHPSMRDVIQRISEIKGIPENEAINMFMLLLNKKVLFDLPGDLGISLNPMLVTDAYWNKEWNIVSNTDMTLNKWMIAHGYEHKY